MTAKEAVARRIQNLCIQHDLAVNGLANQCGIPAHQWRLLCGSSERVRITAATVKRKSSHPPPTPISYLISLISTLCSPFHLLHT